MDIALQIIINPATHDLSYAPAKNARRQTLGDVIDVILATDIAAWDGDVYLPSEPVSSPRTGFVFVVNVPDGLIKALKNKFSAAHFSVETLLLRHRYNVSTSDMPAATLDQLSADKFITVPWLNVKGFFKDKTNGKFITDADLP